MAPSGNMQALISDEYKEIQNAEHADPDYGYASNFYAELIAAVINECGADKILDYGAGKGGLGKALAPHIKRPITVLEYDPAIPSIATPPEPCPLVACIDVLEHIEPDLLDNVLDDLVRVCSGFFVFTVSTTEAIRFLPDGRNAHLIVKPLEWWLPKFWDRFGLHSFARITSGFWITGFKKA